MKALFFICFSLLLLVSRLAGAADDGEKESALPPREEIVDFLQRIVGLGGEFAIEKIDPARLSEANVPFLNRAIRDQMGIRVIYSPAKMRWRGKWHGAPDAYLRRFTIYLDAKANKLIAVKSRVTEPSRDLRPELPAEVTEKQLNENGVIYASFPAGAPKVTFMEALESAAAHGLTYSPKAQEINGLYVMEAVERTNPDVRVAPYPIWIIAMRGLPPFQFPMPFVAGGKIKRDPSMLSYSQDLIDPVTGNWKGGGINNRVTEAEFEEAISKEKR